LITIINVNLTLAIPKKRANDLRSFSYHKWLDSNLF
jgi:hypothetical protein